MALMCVGACGEGASAGASDLAFVHNRDARGDHLHASTPCLHYD